MRMWKYNRRKPVIGLAGGIGSGKSTVASLFGSLGCAVIDSDALGHRVLQLPEVKAEILAWLGPGVFDADGSVNRGKVAREVFTDPARSRRLNGLIHPKVGAERERLTAAAMADPAVKAVLWDSPLLFENGLNRACDAVVFVKTPRETRLKRLKTRGWTPEELDKREKLQFSLDKKAQLADYDIDNSDDEASTLRQVEQVLSRIISFQP